MLNGQLSFSQVLEGEDFIAFSSYGEDKHVFVIPSGLNIHTLPDGTPAFFLEAIRGITPFSQPKPYGLLEIQVAPAEITIEMSDRIRRDWTDAALYTPDFTEGYLNFHLIGEGNDQLPEELSAPIPVSGLPLSRIRYVRKISLDSLDFIKQGLQNEILLLEARGVFMVKGLAKRIPVKIQFNPAELFEDLKSTVSLVEQKVPLSSLRNYFERDLNKLPIKIVENEMVGSLDLSDILIDHFSTRYFSLAPITSEQHEVHLLFPAKESFQPGDFRWDLSEHFMASRYFFFKLNPLQEARTLVLERGIDSLLRTSIVESLPTGFLRLVIVHPFYHIPKGILRIGIKLEVPANPPVRTQAIHETVVFDDGQERKVVELRFSPGEEQHYAYTPFLIYHDTQGTHEINGETKRSFDQVLTIHMWEYPMSFIALSASPNILSQAHVIVSVYRKGQEEVPMEPFDITPDKSAVLAAVPGNNDKEVVCEVTARSLISSEEVTTVLHPSQSIKIDLTSFPEYGTHEVTVKVVNNKSGFFAVDLLPASQEDLPQNKTTLTFMGDIKNRTWSWFSSSLFQAGFQYRIHTHGETPSNWSDVISPFIHTLTLGDLSNKTAMENEKIFEGIRYYANPSMPNVYYFLPASPGPQTDPNGDPMLSLIGAGATWFLQMGTKWQAPSDILEELRQKLNIEHQDEAPILMNIAPISVEKVELVLYTQDDEKVLASSGSSGSYPFTAALNASIPSDLQEEVVSAIHGKAKVLMVNYHYIFEQENEVAMELSGSLLKVREELGADSTLENIREWVEKEIESGQLVLQVSHNEDTPGELIEDTRKKLLETATGEVHRFLSQPGTDLDASDLLVKAKETYKIPVKMMVSTDIGEWFTGNAGDDHIKIVA